ncbi:S-adenosyl-L-methionine-dependent methyltransferase [Rhypophila sp. PSN 637]
MTTSLQKEENERNLAAESISSWETNATYWDSVMGLEGNKYWKKLQVPCLQRMLKKKSSGHVFTALELATGNGLGARFLASHGAKSVLATDAAEAMLDIADGYLDLPVESRGSDARAAGTAAERETKLLRDIISLRRLDVTKDEEFEALLKDVALEDPDFPGYDVILLNMAIMDIATLGPLARALPKLLAKDGMFIATILHPLFSTSDASRSVTQHYNHSTGEQETVRSVIVREYLNVPPAKGIALPGQPEKQLYFHRPIHELLGTFLKGGQLALDMLEEPAFTAEDRDERRVESTCNFIGVPALFAFRLRRKV